MDFSLKKRPPKTDFAIYTRPPNSWEAEVRPSVKEMEKAGEFPGGGHQETRRDGAAGGMLVPEEWGRAGLDTVTYVLIAGRSGHACLRRCLTAAWGWTNSAGAGAACCCSAREAQKKKIFAAPMAAGENARSVLPDRAGRGFFRCGGDPGDGRRRVKVREQVGVGAFQLRHLPRQPTFGFRPLRNCPSGGGVFC